MDRKLAAIFSTGVVGYSRLMGEEEGATIRTLIRRTSKSFPLESSTGAVSLMRRGDHARLR